MHRGKLIVAYALSVTEPMGEGGEGHIASDLHATNALFFSSPAAFAVYAWDRREPLFETYCYVW